MFFFWLFDAGVLRKGRHWCTGVLFLLAAASAVSYFDFGYYPKFGTFLNPHDFFHYYMGSKYSPEVGYLNLYPAALIADSEDRPGRLRQTTVRSMETYRFIPVRTILADKERYKKPFTAERWREFKQDASVFRSLLGEGRWAVAFKDKGYNATPIWNMVARSLSSVVPSTHLTRLMRLDLLLLIGMFGLIGWAFGLRTMLLAVLFFGTMFPMSYTHIRGAFLRLDWVTMLVAGICLIKKGHFRTAGACMAYAGAARIFPTVFVFGLGVKFALDVIRRRRIDRSYLGFFVTFAVVAGVLFAASVAVDGGLHGWREFLAKIRLHDDDLSPIRVGFRYVFLMTYVNTYDAWGPFEAAKLLWFKEHQALWWGIQGVMLAISGYLVQRLEDHEAIAYGYVPAYFLFAPTFYYHVMLIVPLFLFLPKLKQWPRTLGAALLFGVSILLYALNQKWRLDLQLSFTMSCALLAISLYMLIASAAAGPMYIRSSETDNVPVATKKGKKT